MDDSRVCIIGAGSSGLVAAKVLAERGIPFDCFELGSGIGGLWRYNNDSGLSAAYRSLHINTSRDKMAFSDFPMPHRYPDFPHHSQILAYFERYAEHFDLRQRITFRTAVKHIQPVGDGTYDVIVEPRGGLRRCRRYAAVLVASGHHWDPRIPSFPGTFAGCTLHSHEYRTPDAMADKNVLVVGLGNSGCDIACEVSRVARRTFLSTRRGGHIIPKYLFGKPLDRVVPAWVWRHLPLWIFQRMFGAALRLSRGPVERYGLPKPQHRILEEHPTISSDLLNLIGHGRIQVKPNVSELSGDSVRFADESQEPIDTIVYATGYNITFPFLNQEVLNPAGNRVSLYKRVVHPGQPNLYFIGLVQPWGALMPLAEAQSEWVGDLLSGECALPPRELMLADMTRADAAVRRRYLNTERHTIQVDFYPYLAELARERQAGRKRPQAAPAVATPQSVPLRRAA
jgi:cation diffusion facilitator CzcD-associated flavoprotein CzcO